MEGLTCFLLGGILFSIFAGSYSHYSDSQKVGCNKLMGANLGPQLFVCLFMIFCKFRKIDKFCLRKVRS